MNGWIPIPFDYLPFGGAPSLPTMAPILFEDFAPPPYQMYQPEIPPYKMYEQDVPPPFSIYQPEVPSYDIYQPDPFLFPSPHQMYPFEQHPLAMPSINEPISKLGFTFQKSEPVPELPELPPLTVNKFTPEKIGRTFPSNNYATERYNPPPVSFNHQSTRMEPIVVQSSPTLGMLANLWNKKE